MTTQEDTLEPSELLELEAALIVLRMRGPVSIIFGALGVGSNDCILKYQPYILNHAFSEEENEYTICVRGTFEEIMVAIKKAVS